MSYNVAEIIEGLELIQEVSVDYTLGRRRNLSDEEAEDVAKSAVFLAMTALEKQIPMMPKDIIKVQQTDVSRGYCGNCGVYLLDYNNFCWNCGRKIMWGK